jgi:putative SOS response-associated peptidase YedK
MLAEDRAKIAEHFDMAIGLDLKPRYNIAPGQEIAVVRYPAASAVREIVMLRWGLVPSWAKDPSIGFKMINARAETISVKPAFREAIRRRRCLIPTTGFYEWRREGRTRTPFCFVMLDGGVFALAGIWERWLDPAGQVLETASILTTAPNAVMEGLHDRMPVILPPSSYDLWLDPAAPFSPVVSALLQPFDASQMQRRQVSSRVNFVKYDDPACAESIISV